MRLYKNLNDNWLAKCFYTFVLDEKNVFGSFFELVCLTKKWIVVKNMKVFPFSDKKREEDYWLSLQKDEDTIDIKYACILRVCKLWEMLMITQRIKRILKK